MKKIGLTGGIGSGKSYVAKVFEAIGVPVFYADDEAKKILNSPTVLQQLESIFNESITDLKTNQADRKKIATIVFNNHEKLTQLNQVIHPLVEHHFVTWSQKYIAHKYVLKEAAILFESGSYKNLDGVIAVVSPLELRLQRVMMRDNTSKEEVLRRINNQWTDEQRIQHSNWIVYNEENKPLLSQILAIHHQIAQL